MESDHLDPFREVASCLGCDNKVWVGDKSIIEIVVLSAELKLPAQSTRTGGSYNHASLQSERGSTSGVYTLTVAPGLHK
jgi:hypothetical protein